MEIIFKALELEDLQSTIDLCNLCFDEVTDYDYAKKVFLETRNDSNNIYANYIRNANVNENTKGTEVKEE